MTLFFPDLEVFLDSGDPQIIQYYSSNPTIKGFTTNPTLIRKAGIISYRDYSSQVAEIIPHDKSVSLEVLSDTFREIYNEAIFLSSLASNIYVKIPITYQNGQFTTDAIIALQSMSVKLNITAVMCDEQLLHLSKILDPSKEAILSIFAGRIADTLREPEEVFQRARQLFKNYTLVKFLWASTRELYNIMQAARCGSNIITVTPDLIPKFSLIDKDLADFSLETVKMFYTDAQRSGYTLDLT